MEGGIPPLIELLEFTDAKVQRAAAGALRTLAFKNDENKNQVTDLPLEVGLDKMPLVLVNGLNAMACRLLNAMLFLLLF